MAETQTCPRRNQELGPWKKGPGLDVWLSGRWVVEDSWRGWLTRRTTRLRNAWNRWKQSRGARSVIFVGERMRLWPGPWVPRVCSFCGGLNPDDAIRLVEEGWEVEAASGAFGRKEYKRYLNAPGYRSAMAAARSAPTVRIPAVSPPVKVYTQHFENDHVERFNRALRARSAA